MQALLWMRNFFCGRRPRLLTMRPPKETRQKKGCQKKKDFVRAAKSKNPLPESSEINKLVVLAKVNRYSVSYKGHCFHPIGRINHIPSQTGVVAMLEPCQWPVC